MTQHQRPEAGTPVLYYVHDPMCSWCYAFAPVWQRVREMVAGKVVVKNVLGGLAPDSDAPMPDDMQGYLRGTWQNIETVVPGTVFNHDFWEHCEPRRSTYPACRAVIAARMLGREYEESMITAIQHAYYREARNPSVVETLVELASEIGLDAEEFAVTLAGEGCEQVLQEEIALTRSLGATGFPSLVLACRRNSRQVEYDYNDADATAQRILEGVAAQKNVR